MQTAPGTQVVVLEPPVLRVPPVPVPPVPLPVQPDQWPMVHVQVPFEPVQVPVPTQTPPDRQALPVPAVPEPPVAVRPPVAGAPLPPSRPPDDRTAFADPPLKGKPITAGPSPPVVSVVPRGGFESPSVAHPTVDTAQPSQTPPHTSNETRISCPPALLHSFILSTLGRIDPGIFQGKDATARGAIRTPHSSQSACIFQPDRGRTGTLRNICRRLRAVVSLPADRVSANRQLGQVSVARFAGPECGLPSEGIGGSGA
jgi:hypothetical protein